MKTALLSLLLLAPADPYMPSWTPNERPLPVNIRDSDGGILLPTNIGPECPAVVSVHYLEWGRAPYEFPGKAQYHSALEIPVEHYQDARPLANQIAAQGLWLGDYLFPPSQILKLKVTVVCP